MTAGWLRIFSGLPSAMVSPKSITLICVAEFHHNIHVMFDHPDGHVKCVVNPANQPDQFFGVSRVEPGGRFVEQQQLRMARQGAGDLQFALGAVREVLREFLGVSASDRRLRAVQRLLWRSRPRAAGSVCCGARSEKSHSRAGSAGRRECCRAPSCRSRGGCSERCGRRRER